MSQLPLTQTTDNMWRIVLVWDDGWDGQKSSKISFCNCSSDEWHGTVNVICGVKSKYLSLEIAKIHKPPTLTKNLLKQKYKVFQILVILVNFIVLKFPYLKVFGYQNG